MNKETMISEDARLAVKYGTQWLDENHAGWEHRIDLTALQMNKCDRCVIGQAVGDFYNTVEMASSSSYLDDEGSEWAVDHGFDVNIDMDHLTWDEAKDREDAAYRELEVAWTEVVKERRGL